MVWYSVTCNRKEEQTGWVTTHKRCGGTSKRCKSMWHGKKLWWWSRGSGGLEAGVLSLFWGILGGHVVGWSLKDEHSFRLFSFVFSQVHPLSWLLRAKLRAVVNIDQPLILDMNDHIRFAVAVHVAKLRCDRR